VSDAMLNCEIRLLDGQVVTRPSHTLHTEYYRAIVGVDAAEANLLLEVIRRCEAVEDAAHQGEGGIEAVRDELHEMTTERDDLRADLDNLKDELAAVASLVEPFTKAWDRLDDAYGDLATRVEAIVVAVGAK
jgi:hypothetical protein